MKKIMFYFMSACILLSFIPGQVKAETEKSASPAVTTKTVESSDATVSTSVSVAEAARYEKELARLDEIKAMDLSNLTPAEKKELREEVRSIQNDQEDHDRYRDRDRDGEHHHHHGIYLSVGGGLLIIILLILLL
jgi:Flp pilus assembly protein TadB